jgi:predicted cytidylate kinase
MQTRIITISGEVCSGKSSVAKALVGLLPGWQRINTGQAFRDHCAKLGLSIQEVAHLPDAVHEEFDRIQRRQLESGERLIVEGRLSGWLARDLPDVHRVYCVAPLETRIQRYMTRDGRPCEQALADIEYRDAGDVEKYRRVYGIDDYRSAEFYHLFLDTSTGTPVELAREVVESTGIPV